MIELLIQSIEATGENEGVWFGLSDEEIGELRSLIESYKENNATSPQ
jgi:hypothetical protein